MTPLPPNITLAARRRADALRDQALGAAWHALATLLLRPFRAPAPKEQPCRS